MAVASYKRVHNSIIPKVASGFCSGMARSGGLCGAVSGGMIGIGLILGRSSPAYDIDPSYQAVQEFLQRFSAQYKSLSCLELTGIFLDTPEGQAVFQAKGQMLLCTDYVGNATRMVVDILDKMDNGKPSRSGK